MRLKRQTRLLPYALPNSTEATSTVSVGQAIASSNGFIGATRSGEAAHHHPSGVALGPAIAL
jgi:hypothetical protein